MKCLVWFILVASTSVICADDCVSHNDKGNTRCCVRRQCYPGTQPELCAHDGELAVCTPCRAGYFQSQTIASTDVGVEARECQKHAICGPREKVKTLGNATHDTVCECNWHAGYVADRDLDCVTVDECPLGETMARNGCIACGDDKFKNHTGYGECTECSTCVEGLQMTLVQCNSTSDTVCADTVVPSDTTSLGGLPAGWIAVIVVTVIVVILIAVCIWWKCCKCMPFGRHCTDSWTWPSRSSEVNRSGVRQSDNGKSSVPFLNNDNHVPGPVPATSLDSRNVSMTTDQYQGSPTPPPDRPELTTANSTAHDSDSSVPTSPVGDVTANSAVTPSSSGARLPETRDEGASSAMTPSSSGAGLPETRDEGASSAMTPSATTSGVQQGRGSRLSDHRGALVRNLHLDEPFMSDMMRQEVLSLDMKTSLQEKYNQWNGNREKQQEVVGELINEVEQKGDIGFDTFVRALAVHDWFELADMLDHKRAVRHRPATSQYYSHFNDACGDIFRELQRIALIPFFAIMQSELSDRVITDIQKKQKQHDNDGAISALLDFILQELKGNREKPFKRFISALIDSGLNDTADELSTSLADEHRRRLKHSRKLTTQQCGVLRQHRADLVKYIDLNTTLVSHLVSSETLSQHDETTLDAKLNRDERLTELLNMIENRLPTSFDNFVAALRESKQAHVAAMLDDSLKDVQKLSTVGVGDFELLPDTDDVTPLTSSESATAAGGGAVGGGDSMASDFYDGPLTLATPTQHSYDSGDTEETVVKTVD